MRTEVVRRVVLESGQLEGLTTEDGDVDGTPTGQERENLRFWTAVLDEYCFSDVNVDVPETTKQSVLWIRVRRFGFGDYGLPFVGFLDRSDSIIGCYVTCRATIHPAVEIYGDIERSLDDLRSELGDELEQWKNKQGRPRIGFTRPTRFPLPTVESTSGEFEDAAQWMRERLERLVSTLHPRLERMISDRT